MTAKHTVTDEQILACFRKTADLNRRMQQGTLEPQAVLDSLQQLIEGEKLVLATSLPAGTIQTIDGATVTSLGTIRLPAKKLTLSERIQRGKYDYTNDHITADRFKITLGANRRKLALIHFNRNITSKEVEKWVKANGYEVAQIEDLLALGAHKKHCDLQRQIPIICLGSSAVVGGRRYVPCLYGSGDRRSLNLGWYGGGGWGDCRRFLVVCK